jgi:drug/metabolite transporter (DMT)-like permease
MLMPVVVLVVPNQTIPALAQPLSTLAQPALAVLLLGLVCTGFAYAVFFRLVADEGAPRAVTVTFLVPFAATVWGILLLHEHVTTATLLGMALVLAGTAFSLGLIDPVRVLAGVMRRTAPKAP